MAHSLKELDTLRMCLVGSEINHRNCHRQYSLCSGLPEAQTVQRHEDYTSWLGGDHHTSPCGTGPPLLVT